MLGSIISIVVTGFVVGGLARWALPGPDPMPFWLTVLFGLTGSILGGGIAMAALRADVNHVTPSDNFTIVLGSIVATILLLVAYRRFIQRRPITGPEAQKPPTRGWGLRGPGLRGPGRAAPSVNKTEVLKRLDDLHDEGVLTEEEYVSKRREVLSWP